MYVGHERNADGFADRLQRAGGGLVRNGDPDDVAPAEFELPDLGDRGRDIARIGLGH